MKRIIFIAVVLLFASSGYAQKDSSFYKHEIRVSAGDALLATVFWAGDLDSWLYGNVSFSYFYRPVKWFWVGGNFLNYVGKRIYYDVREYYPNGRYRDFSTSKIKYCGVVAPEIRFSYLNQKTVILYTALSGGVCFENGFDNRFHKYPKKNPYVHLTYFGFSCNFGENQTIFVGGEFGIGFKGFFSFHGGLRF
jgi:hypothetical protein